MKHESLLTCGCAALVMVDMQEKLIPAMSGQDELLKYARILLQAAGVLQLPLIVTEQYPKGLGHTLPDLAGLLPPSPTVVEKTSFSCARAEGFLEKLQATAATQVLLFGIETHVCLLQTALDLAASGYQVHVAADAVSSRAPQNKENALFRLRRAGVIVTNTESALFELLGKAEGDAFKAISRLIR